MFAVTSAVSVGFSIAAVQAVSIKAAASKAVIFFFKSNLSPYRQNVSFALAAMPSISTVLSSEPSAMRTSTSIVFTDCHFMT